MNGLESSLTFVVGCVVGSYLGYVKSIIRFNKVIDTALDEAKEKENKTIGDMHEKNGWLDCLSFLLKSYR